MHDSYKILGITRNLEAILLQSNRQLFAHNTHLIDNEILLVRFAYYYSILFDLLRNSILSFIFLMKKERIIFRH